MKNEKLWRPSKYVLGRNGIGASPSAPIASRLVIRLVGNFVASALRSHARLRLLDLGCGSAPFYAVYRPLVSDVTCVDWGNSLHSIDHLDFQHDLAEPLPFADGSFETILLTDVLEHLPEPERLWSEVARLLVPGGKLILNVPFLYRLHEVPHDYFRYTEYALQRFAGRAGLRVVELHRIGGAVDVLADLSAKVIVGLPLGKPVSVAIQGLAVALGRTKLGLRFRISSSKATPLGYGMVVQK
jgi:SAM-dependent methyltransferase